MKRLIVIWFLFIGNISAMPDFYIIGATKCETTPGYFWRSQCAKRIASFSPKAKLILMLRDPAKRAISHYFFCEDRKSMSNIYPRYATFEQAIQNEGCKEAIIGIGCYLDHIKRWLEYYPRSQLFIVIFEDLIAHPEQEVN